MFSENHYDSLHLVGSVNQLVEWLEGLLKLIELRVLSDVLEIEEIFTSLKLLYFIFGFLQTFVQLVCLLHILRSLSEAVVCDDVLELLVEIEQVLVELVLLLFKFRLEVNFIFRFDSTLTNARIHKLIILDEKLEASAIRGANSPRRSRRNSARSCG